MDCWIEVEVDGKKTVVGDGLGTAIAAVARDAKRPHDARAGGYVGWSRRKVGDAEVWALGLSVLGEDGQPRYHRLTRFNPPRPGGAGGAGGASGESWWAMDGELSDGKEVALFTVMTHGGEDVKNAARTATLKCRLLK